MAIHSPWYCNSKTRPMKCKYCGETIFYFSCDCGCKIFFDELGEPWPIHECVQYRKAIKAELFTTALKTLNLNDLLFQGESFEIEPEYKEKLKKHRIKKVDDFHIIRIDPNLSRVNDIGYLREVQSKVDLFTIFHEDLTEINLQTLQSINYKGLSKITIVAGDIHSENPQSYTGFVEKNKIRHIEKSNLVDFQITGMKIFFDKLIWFFDWIDIIDFEGVTCESKDIRKQI